MTRPVERRMQAVPPRDALQTAAHDAPPRSGIDWLVLATIVGVSVFCALVWWVVIAAIAAVLP